MLHLQMSTSIPFTYIIDTTGTDFVIALAIHKLSLPVRVPLTLALVPIVHRTLAKTGVLKAVEKIVSKSSASTSAAVVADEMNAADSTADKKTD